MRRCKYRATNCSPKEMPSRRATQGMKMPGTTARLTNNMKASALREGALRFDHIRTGRLAMMVCPLPRYQPVSQSPAALASPWADRSGA